MTTGAHIGRRTHVDLGLVGDAGATCAELSSLIGEKNKTSKMHLKAARNCTRNGSTARHIWPAHAAPNAIFTSDTGMSTVWLSRLVTMIRDQRLIGS